MASLRNSKMMNIIFYLSFLLLVSSCCLIGGVLGDDNNNNNNNSTFAPTNQPRREIPFCYRYFRDTECHDSFGRLYGNTGDEEEDPIYCRADPSNSFTGYSDFEYTVCQDVLLTIVEGTEVLPIMVVDETGGGTTTTTTRPTNNEIMPMTFSPPGSDGEIFPMVGSFDPNSLEFRLQGFFSIYDDYFGSSIRSIYDSWDSRFYIEPQNEEQCWSLLLVAGNCQDGPYSITELVEPNPLTDEWLNAQNERINDDATCGFDELDRTSVQEEDELTTVRFYQCTSCQSQYDYEEYTFVEDIVLKGKRARYQNLPAGYDMILQRSSSSEDEEKDEKVCLAWLHEDYDSAYYGGSYEKCNFECVDIDGEYKVIETTRFQVSATQANINFYIIQVFSGDVAYANDIQVGDPWVANANADANNPGSGSHGLCVNSKQIPAALVVEAVALFAAWFFA